MAKKSISVKGKGEKNSSSASIPVLQTTGALTPQNPAKLLSELLNKGKSSPFGSYQSLSEYSTALRGMTSNEMYKHAVEDVEIVPIDDRNRLIERLEKEFALYRGKIDAYTRKPVESTLTAENKKSIEDILARARRTY